MNPKEYLSPELSKQLKELGVNLQTAYGWRNLDKTFPDLVNARTKANRNSRGVIRTLTFSELWQRMPQTLFIRGGFKGEIEECILEMHRSRCSSYTTIRYCTYNRVTFLDARAFGHDDNFLITALAKLLISCIEQKYIKSEEI